MGTSEDKVVGKYKNAAGATLLEEVIEASVPNRNPLQNVRETGIGKGAQGKPRKVRHGMLRA